MKIAVFSTQPYDEAYFEKFAHTHSHQLTYFEAALTPNTAELAAGFDGVCVFVNDRLHRATIEKLAALQVRLIALRCAGFNNVDLAAAQEHRIKVVRVPAYSPEAVAEHALALILTLNRKTHKAYNRVREGNFSLNRMTGFNLHRKTVGVIGTGKIGVAFCKIIQGFGCRVLAFDPYPSDALREMGVEYVALDALFEHSNIISLHCPLLPQTHHIINAAALSKMKDGVMIINTSRGALIKTADVIEALKSRKVAYLGIDVYEQEEKLFFQDLSESVIDDDMILTLNSFPNVLITAHQAFFTEEALNQITTTTLQNISDFDNNDVLKNEVKIV